MADLIQILVYENRQLAQTAEFDGPVELGRQRNRDEHLFSRTKVGANWRWVIARLDENTVGRNQILLTPINDASVKVTNGSDKQPIRFLDRADLQPGTTSELALPVLIILGPTKTIRIQVPSSASSFHSASIEPFKSLPAPTKPPLGPPDPPGPGVVDWVNDPNLVRLLVPVIELLSEAACSNEFFPRAARATVSIAALDDAVILTSINGNWMVEATYTQTEGTQVHAPSQALLDRVRFEKRTFWMHPALDASASLAGLAAVVGAPILGRQGEVVGAIQGSRRRADSGGRPHISEGQATLVELVARSVAAGLARLEVEREAARAEAASRYRPFFGDSVLLEVVENGLPLTGRNAVVSILFCDIRGFTRISQRIGAERTDEFCSQLLDRLSACVFERDGVLVDFLGDGLLAMWGAPVQQPDHADRAVAAGLSMLESTEEFSSSWAATLGEPLRLGVGIHTGEAQVGNTGCARKPKYGPRGPAVNLASRIEGATKHFQCSLLLTDPTRKALTSAATSRALGPIRLVGLDDPIEVHQVSERPTGDWDDARDVYHSAFAHFQAHRHTEAVSLLGPWAHRCPSDGPALKLLSRAVSALAVRPGPEHPVWILDQK